MWILNVNKWQLFLIASLTQWRRTNKSQISKNLLPTDLKSRKVSFKSWISLNQLELNNINQLLGSG